MAASGATRFSLSVIETLILLACYFGCDENILIKFVENQLHIRFLSMIDDKIQEGSPWKSTPLQLVTWWKTYFEGSTRSPHEEGTYDYNNEVRQFMTTLGSILISLKGIKNRTPKRDIASKVHDFWVEATKTCLSNFPDKLEERDQKGQFLSFDEMKPEEQDKDILFVEKCEEFLKNNLIIDLMTMFFLRKLS